MQLIELTQKNNTIVLDFNNELNTLASYIETLSSTIRSLTPDDLDVSLPPYHIRQIEVLTLVIDKLVGEINTANDNLLNVLVRDEV